MKKKYTKKDIIKTVRRLQTHTRYSDKQIKTAIKLRNKRNKK